jgi:hypothetical protein
MKSVDMSWVDCSRAYYGAVERVVTPLFQAINEAQIAISTVSGAGDIGNLRIPLSYDDIESLNEKRRRLVSFSNAIHYEISELIDNPFSIRVAEILEAAYSLDPKNYKAVTGRLLFWNTETSLGDLLLSIIIDSQLKADFDNRINALNNDKPSAQLKDAITEARFWQSEFNKSNECQRIAAEVFTANVRSNWDSMTRAERETIVQSYSNQISQVLFKKNTTVVYDAGGFGYSQSGGRRRISINPDFVTYSNPEGSYTVDKVIDTLTHEMRHQYQHQVTSSWTNKYKASDDLLSQWNAPYIQSSTNYTDYYRQEVERDARAFAALSRPE